MSTFVTKVNENYFPDSQENIMFSLFRQYERVIFESIITSFGLDDLIKDQHGGDVDTIFNVRKIGVDAEMQYKNKQNKQAYENRAAYDYRAYHDGNPTYQAMKRDTKKQFQSSGTPVTDVYTGNSLYFYSKGASKGKGEKQASIDHVLTAHTMHNDPGRVLSGLRGEDLANSNENLVFTNASLNSSMGATKENDIVVEIPEYIAKHPELPDETKERMMREYDRAKKAYEAKLAHAYYTSPKFWGDTAKTTGKMAALMGIRQVWGFIFTEVWFSVKDEFEKVNYPLELEHFLQSIGNGIKKGFERAKEKYKDLIEKFMDGAVAGAMSSLTTTLCNIFFTTAKNTVRIIRQTYASLVQAAKVLFLNPDNLPFGERIRATSKIIATGASVVVGVLVSEALEDTGIGKLPVVGEIITTFCGSLVTGIMTCTLLCFLDRSKIANELVSFLNQVPSMSADVNFYYEQAKLFENYAAKLMEIDLAKFRAEVQAYEDLALKINSAASETELNHAIKNVLDKVGVQIPWQGNFSDFMKNKNNRLVFK